MNAGIDYGMGRTNIDTATGIRYGVISQSSVMQAWADSSEADYGDPTCPACGSNLVEYDESRHGEYEAFRDHSCADFACDDCEHYCESQDAYGDEPVGWHCTDSDYEAVDCLDSDIMILKSPYYTKAVFCSPCVPGACSIESPNDDGAKAYCFGHDWFEDGKAPYPVFSVATGEEIHPSAT